MQDYFTKWADASPLLDKTASRITTELVDLFPTYGVPEIVHSDQGRNFESAIFQQVLKAFGVKKTRTTAYRPQGDGMVERFNCTLLQLLRTHVTRQEEWEKHLPLAFYAYRTSVHSSTGVSPFELMYGRQPERDTLMLPPTAYAPGECGETLHAKLAELTDLVEAHMAVAAEGQRQQYNKHTHERSFKVDDPVWLSISTAGKLDPRWEGNWVVTTCKSPVNFAISDGSRRRVVHVNRIRHRHQPSMQLHVEDALPEN